MLAAVGILLFMGLLTVRLEPSGIRESIGPLTLKRISANEIHTVVRHFIPGRVPIIVLAFSSLSPKELEMRGEARLRRDPKYRHTLKFREGKPDWGDLCLGCGFRRKGMLFIEYSEERKKLIQSLYPHAEFREAKQMEDPIQSKNERSI